ncbi:uncharacterized protein [Palaemon carinicauda]|uniref:uncharacterized protein isoform X3 n=1 Tax=Palaemon carinicauda TaxID=392227 RepID=UPI0035B5A414
MSILVWSSALTIVVAVRVAAIEVTWTDPADLDLVKSHHYLCPREGRFPHPWQCGKYVECIRDSKKGIFRKRFKNCHGAVFNSTRKICMMTEEGDECASRPRTARSLTVDRRFSSICDSRRNGFFCADCKTVVNCIEGVAFVENCGTSDTCSKKDAFGGAICYPTPEPSCSCSRANAFFIDPYDTQMFFFCSATEAEPDMYHCPGEMIFDESTQQCKNANGFSPCMEAGVFAYHDDCTQYYTCIASQNGWIQKPFSCSDGLMYNEIKGQCEDPCSWDTGKFTCQREGRFSDPLSCDKYYECVLLSDGSFRQDQRQCPHGYEWVQSELGVGRCGKGPSPNCQPLTLTKCIIPDTCSEAPAGSVAPAGSAAPASSIRSGQLITNFRTSGGNSNPPQYAFVHYPVGSDSVWNPPNRGDRRARVSN